MGLGQHYIFIGIGVVTLLWLAYQCYRKVIHFLHFRFECLLGEEVLRLSREFMCSPDTFSIVANIITKEHPVLREEVASWQVDGMPELFQYVHLLLWINSHKGIFKYHLNKYQAKEVV